MTLLLKVVTVMMLSASPTAVPDTAPEPERWPVLLVHGIDDDARMLAPLARYLKEGGFGEVQPMELRPNDGGIPIAAMAAQVAAQVEALRARTGREKVDVVAFSMGALVSRYYVQRMGGQQYVRRFVSISGPHGGTLTAWFRNNAGAREMRPGSELLRALASDVDPFGPVQVFSLWTPWDLMILPATSSRLPGVRERSVPVLVHPWMMTDGRAHRAVVEALTVHRPEDFSTAPATSVPPGL